MAYARAVDVEPAYVQREKARQRRIRMGAFEQEMERYPGAVPGGSGPTGIAPNLGATGKRDWDALVNRQVQYAQDIAGEEGGALPVTVARPATVQGGSTMPQAAMMRGLRAETGDDDSFLNRLIAGRSPEGGVRALREAGLLPSEDVLTAQNRQARRAGMSPLELAAEAQDIEERFARPEAERAADVADIMAEREGRRYALPNVRSMRDEQRRIAMQMQELKNLPGLASAEADEYAAELGLEGRLATAEGAARGASMRGLSGVLGQALRANPADLDKLGLTPDEIQELYNLILQGQRGGR